MKRAIGRVPPRADEADADRGHPRAFWLREGVIFGGFLLLVVAAALTVAVPELRKQPEEKGGTAGMEAVAATGETAEPSSASVRTP